MQYVFDGELYKIIKITGPQHNMLALGFGESLAAIEVKDLKKSKDNVINIFPLQVRNQVLRGLNEINEELGTNYKVVKIQFVSSDSPSETIYVELSKEIVKRLNAGEKFTRI